VAGTIAAANDGFGSTGVAFDATIMPVRVLDSGGAGSFIDVAAGIRYAVDNGAHVINLSLGGSYSSAVYSALTYAGEHGVFVAVAAGNDGAATPSYPAAFSAELTNVLSVGAHDANDATAWFSNGVGTSGAVQVAAPGVDIYSTFTGNRYGLLSGTSMATPHVAGLAALALSANPGLDPQTLRSLIVEGADRPITGSDSSGGINAAMAVASAERYTATGESQTATATTSGESFLDTSAQTLQGRRHLRPARPEQQYRACAPVPSGRPNNAAFQPAIDALFADLGDEPGETHELTPLFDRYTPALLAEWA
jgi:subtilisin family serine protease